MSAILPDRPPARRARAPWGAMLLSLAFLLVGCNRAEPRNVLLIVVDTLRADHLGTYGYERPTSPHLDRRAEGAVVFERALTTSPWTVPAFGSLLTGLPPSAHGGGMKVEGATAFYERTGIDQQVVTLAEHLRQHGLATVALVSNAFLKPRSGFGRGFDEYRYYHGRNGSDGAFDWALDWLDEHGEDRFFMMLHLMDPHAPYAPPEPFRGRFTGETEFRKVRPLKERRARAAEYTESDRDYFVGRYDEEIVALDELLERFFDGLGERWSDTIVVFVSDHGEEILEHGSFDHGHSMMQELLHVPMLVWAPGLEPRRVAVPVSVADVTPTVLEALGLEVELPADSGVGRSFWGIAKGDEPSGRRDLFAENMLFGEELKALIRWPYKLVLDPATGERRLFDLDADPSERRDVAAERAEIADRLEAVLRAYAAGPRSRGQEPGALDAETARELEALGYVN